MDTLEDFIRKNAHAAGLQGSEYSLKVFADHDGILQIYLHPTSRDGETVEYYLKRDNLYQKTAFDNLSTAIFSTLKVNKS